jgi:hypothetical protein
MKNIRGWVIGSVMFLSLIGMVVSRTEIQDALIQRVKAGQPKGPVILTDQPISNTPTDPALTPSLLPTGLPTETSEPIRECREFTEGTITCRIQQASCSFHPSTKGKPTFCNDAQFPNHNFTYLVWGKDVSSLDGRCLILEGSVEIYKGKAEIISEDGSAFVGFCDEE